ncbi:MAG: M48 family metallopeptidase [Pseudomonadota bacterium]
MAAIALFASPAAHADPDGLRALQRYDQMVTSIGYRLATAGGDLCPGKVPLTGFVLHDLAQYPDTEQAAARTAFGFAGDPLVLAVAPDSPAAAAGIREGDALLTIDGAPIPAPMRAQKSYARMAALLAQVDAAAADGTLDLGMRRAGTAFAVHLVPARGCASRYQTNVSTTVDSQADGTYVEINTGLVDFAGSEDQVAAIVAHELAHNILRHRARLDAKGIRRGVLGQFGRSARLVRQTEEEADRLSVYLLDRAGYPTAAIIAFWEHYRGSHILGFLRAPTHMSETARIAMVRGEIARIAAMKAAGESPRPAFMSGGVLPELK